MLKEKITYASIKLEKSMEGNRYMYICVFIDCENIEKTAKQEFGSVIDYEELVRVIKEVANSNGAKLVGIQAYGNFDKGTAGLVTKLMNLGIQPKHIVTKTSSEYLKGSTDIELSLDILETMYRYPHITDYMFVSGDSDLRYVIKRLKYQGKNLKVMGFNISTSYFLKELVDEFIPFDNYPWMLRKVTKSEKEQMALSSISNRFVQIIIKEIKKLENESTYNFIGLNYFKKRLTDYHSDYKTEISEAITMCIDNDILNTYQEPNPKDPNYPTTACKLNMENPAVNYVLNNLD